MSTSPTVYCIGRNYAEHAQELNNPVPDEPVIFLKSPVCITALQGKIELPADCGRLDYETEIYILLKKDIWRGAETDIHSCVSGYGVALDLTLRDKQDQLKQKKHPWTMAKNFIHACPISPITPLGKDVNLQELSFGLRVNGQIKQEGNTRDMLFPILDLINYISHRIPLRKSDIILTGTPAGVGPIQHEDALEVFIESKVCARMIASMPKTSEEDEEELS